MNVPECEPDIKGDVKRHPDLYFPDGSVILQAGSTLFCVHMSQLSRHSAFFRDMFSLPQSGSSTDGPCPTLELHDAPEDVASLLRALYDGPVFESHGRTDFARVAGILRLSTKYLLDSIRANALAHLRTAWPTTLKDWDIREERARAYEAESSLHGGLFYPSPVEIINLARDIGAPELLPAAFYDLARYQYTQIFEASNDDPLYASEPRADPSAVLSAADMRKLALGKEAIQQAVVTLVKAMDRNSFRDAATFQTQTILGRVGAGPAHRRQLSSRACGSPASCRREFAELVELATQHYLLDREHGFTDPLYVAEELVQVKAAEYSDCKSCAKALENWASRERERMWKLIPQWFRLEN